MHKHSGFFFYSAVRMPTFRLVIFSVSVFFVLFAGCAYNAPLDDNARISRNEAVVFAGVSVNKGLYGAFSLQSDADHGKLLFWQQTNLFNYTPKRLLAFAVPAGRYNTNGWVLHVDRHTKNPEVLTNKRKQLIFVQLDAGTVYYLGQQTIEGIMGKSLFGTKIVMDSKLVITDELQTQHKQFIAKHPHLADWPVVSLATQLQAGTTVASATVDDDVASESDTNTE